MKTALEQPLDDPATKNGKADTKPKEPKRIVTVQVTLHVVLGILEGDNVGAKTELPIILESLSEKDWQEAVSIIAKKKAEALAQLEAQALVI